MRSMNYDSDANIMESLRREPLCNAMTKIGGDVVGDHTCDLLADHDGPHECGFDSGGDWDGPCGFQWSDDDGDILAPDTIKEWRGEA